MNFRNTLFIFATRMLTTKVQRYILLLVFLFAVGLCLQQSLYAKSFTPALSENSLHETDSLNLENAKADNVSLVADSLAIDSLSADSVGSKKGSGLTAVVNYKASDSLVFSMGNMAYLYGQTEVTYDDITLTAERMTLSLDSSLVHANGMPDTTAQPGSKKLIGAPVFKDKSGEYETRTISYNFKSAKGFITDVVTQQGDGYVTGGTTKKMPDNDIFLENGRYTTCDNHECPHFYINLTKARVRPKKNIVTGPAYLVVADVPLPLAIPFGFFPFTKSYSSGVIMPTYGADMSRGLYLRDGGYYFAVNDFFDLSLKGDVYTKGSWGLSAATKYAVRYKFRGNFSLSYLKTITGDKGMPDYSESTNFKARWSHSQDSRFNPNMTLSASVDYSTSGYERNNLTSYYSSEMTQSTKQSSVNLSYKIPNSNWSFNASTTVSQRQQDSTLSVDFPSMTIAMSRLYPFKRKVKIGQERWYEKIAMSYSGQISNSITTKQDKFLHSSLAKDWTNGMTHSIPISATFTVLKYINISPSFNLTDRMYGNRELQFYDPSIKNADGSFGGIARDTTYGFYNVFNYSTSISANTKFYGFWTPAPFFKNPKLVAVRHLFTPTISFSYNPDFGDPKYGAYKSYEMPDPYSPTGFKTVEYSPFQKNKYGTAPRGRSGSISFGMSNNIEAKFRSEKDSTGYKKVSIIDNMQTSINYNLAADSMRWSSTIPLTVVIKTGKSGSMNLNGTFDTYMYEISPNGKSLYHVDVPRWKVGKMPRLMSTGYSYSFQLNNKKLAELFGRGNQSSNDDKENDLDMDNDEVNEDLDPSYEKERTDMNAHQHATGNSEYDSDGYLIWSIPWTLNVSYSMRYAYNTNKIDFEKKEFKRGIVHNASVSGTIQPTKNWNISYNLNYDLNAKKVTYMNVNMSRDMHCWTFTGSVNPLGRYASFHVCIAVKSSMLSDLKYEKSSASGSNKIRWYDDY